MSLWTNETHIMTLRIIITLAHPYICLTMTNSHFPFNIRLMLNVLFISSSGLFLSVLGRNGVRGETGVSDDDLASDVLSHYSSASESASVIEEGTGTQRTSIAKIK